LKAVIVPCYNEEKNIAKTIKDIKKNIPRTKIIIVDDGSKDKTFEIAKHLKVIVLKHSKNKGKGEALKTAFRYVKKSKINKIVIMDADLQFSAKDAKRVLDAVDGYDFVMGYRNWKKLPFRHWLGNFVWKTPFNILFGTKLKDTNCGLMAMNSKVLDKVEVGGGYIIENMILASIIKNGFKMKQIPVNVDYHVIHGLPRGAKVVSGVFFYIISEGIKYRLSKLRK